MSAALSYLYKSGEMWVALHLPPSELEVVFLLPAVVLIGREALTELGKRGRRGLINDCEKPH